MPKEKSGTQTSRSKVLKAWLLLVAIMIFWAVIGVIYVLQNDRASVPDEPEHTGFHTWITLLFGGFIVISGVAAYLVFLISNGFMSHFHDRFWGDLKGRIFVANLLIPTMVMVGIGLIFSGVTMPTLLQRGLPQGVAFLAPVFASIIVFQIVFTWVNIWAPLEQRVITRRLAAQGLSAAQISAGIFIGLSDPSQGGLKKLGVIEDDVGMLWIDPEELIYHGDREQFRVARDQLMGIEQKIHSGNTTALSGTAHVILRLRQPNGAERTLRLHIETVWTMGQKRREMDALAGRLRTWISSPPPIPV